MPDQAPPAATLHPLLLEKIAPAVLTALRRRQLNDRQIAALTPAQAFKEFCEWHGVMKLDAVLLDAIDSLRAATGGRRQELDTEAGSATGMPSENPLVVPRAD